MEQFFVIVVDEPARKDFQALLSGSIVCLSTRSLIHTAAQQRY
jgi:hypothetical protein